MLALALAGTLPALAEPDPEARFLIFVFDAVPYQAMVDLTAPDEEPGLLQEFAGPVPVVSTYPSNTGVALTAILNRWGLEPPPGYEVKFFDLDEGKVRGGGLISYSNIRFDWHHFFDWQLRGFFRKSWAYARPLAYSVKEVDKALEAFEATAKRDFFVYVNSTDAIGHIRGPEGLRLAFENLDRQLEALRSRSTVPIHTVILSDHGLGGGVLLPNARKGVFQALRQAGWRITGRLRRPGDVVLTPFGLVSSFEAYTAPGEESGVAEAIVTAPGVDLCAYRSDVNAWKVVRADAEASFYRRKGPQGPEWSYRPEVGDPLKLDAVTGKLRSRDPDGDWFAERRWFEASWNASYPDPLFRIAGGFERVENPASVLCSVSNGFLYGAKSSWIGSKLSVGRVRWTHGALLRNETLGFLMTDLPGWTAPTALRFDHALDFLADLLIDDPGE